MRDFKANGDINVNGDIVINDYSSQQHKPLVQCNVEELENEQAHRFKLLKDEKKRKRNESFGYVKFSFFVGIALSLWFLLAGESNIAMYIVGIVGVIIPLFAAKSTSEETTEFELRQLEVLKEIEYLLRERK